MGSEGSHKKPLPDWVLRKGKGKGKGKERKGKERKGKENQATKGKVISNKRKREKEEEKEEKEEEKMAMDPELKRLVKTFVDKKVTVWKGHQSEDPLKGR